MGRGTVVLLALLGALLLGGAAGAAPASAEVVWLCEPEQTPNPCRDTLRTTEIDASGGSRVLDPALPERPAADCFYVYPTVSEQPGTNADKSRDPALVSIAQYQASRFSQECRVYAPI